MYYLCQKCNDFVSEIKSVEKNPDIEKNGARK